MERLNFSISIHAPREKVWNTMLGKDTYPIWTEVFSPGSHYVGDWNQGSKIHFLAPGETGQMSGMVSRIKENRLYEYLSIEHLGFINNGEEDSSSEAVQNWAGAHENYFFKDIDGVTEVQVEMDTIEEYREMFEDDWPKALTKLKEMTEK